MRKIVITILLCTAAIALIDSLLLAPHRQLKYQLGRHPRSAEDRLDALIDLSATRPSTQPAA